MDKLVTITDDHEDKGYLTHASSMMIGDYVTLCGLDGNDDDPILNQVTIPTPKGAKIDCRACLFIWAEAKRFRKSDFSKEIQND